MRIQMCAVVASAVVLVACTQASEQEVKDAVAKAMKAVGGESKLLKLFRYRERLNVSADPEKKGNERVSIAEPPLYWWLGTRNRVSEDKEPATYLVWGWTLGVLTDAKSKMELIPDVVDGEKQAWGLRVSASVTPAMDLYFDKTSNRLLRIDWRSDIVRFTDWKEHDGVRYASKCIGYKKASGKPWFYSEILELERLKELPANLKR